MERKCVGQQLGVVLKPVTHRVPRKSMKNVRVARFLTPSSRCQTPVESESLREISSPVPDSSGYVFFQKCDEFQELRVAGMRVFPSSRPVRWQEEDSYTSDENVPFYVLKVRTNSFRTTTSPPAHSVMRRDGNSEESLVKQNKGPRSAAKSSNRVWQVHQVFCEACVPPGWKRQRRRYPDCVSERLLCLGFGTSPWFTASCCRDGSLAVVRPLWVKACCRGLITM